MQKQIALVQAGQPSSVGDGFQIRRPLPTRRFPQTSPFLLLDHAGPMAVSPSNRPKGVDEHPHRGFETVTIVYQGALEHRDSAGNYGKIGPGDVQWMTAASGVVHEEKHEKEFTRQGGTLEIIQLWVNLPAKYKMIPPRYQELTAANIPVVPAGNNSKVRVIAGAYGETAGPAHTFTPLQMLDVRLAAGDVLSFSFPEGHNAMAYVLNGKATDGSGKSISEAEMAYFYPNGSEVSFQGEEDTTLLLLSGEPIQEPVASYGPFVMNTQQEIYQAIEDYQAGKMGHL